jgi:hypothetical protein
MTAPARRVALCGISLGVAGLVLFGTVHAIVITAIWDRLFRGVPYAIAVGLAVAWAYHEYRAGCAEDGGVRHGTRFGALAWTAAIPAMAFGFGMRRLPGWGQVHWTVDLVTVILAAAGGATLLWLLRRTRRAACAGALALTLTHAYNGGPMPIESSARAIGLPLGFLVIQVAGGALLGGLHARLVESARHRHANPDGPVHPSRPFGPSRRDQSA